MKLLKTDIHDQFICDVHMKLDELNKVADPVNQS